MKQSLKLRTAGEVAADQAAVDAIPAPGATLKAGTTEEVSEWITEFRKACPEVFNKKLGAKLGPAERMD